MLKAYPLYYGLTLFVKSDEFQEYIKYSSSWDADNITNLFCYKVAMGRKALNVAVITNVNWANKPFWSVEPIKQTLDDLFEEAIEDPLTTSFVENQYTGREEDNIKEYVRFFFHKDVTIECTQKYSRAEFFKDTLV